MKMPTKNRWRKMKEDIQIKAIRAIDGRSVATVALLSHMNMRTPLLRSKQNKLANLFLEKNTEEREKRVSKTASVLQQTVDELKVQLDDYSKKLREFRMIHPGELPDSIAFNNEQIVKLNALLDQTNISLKIQQEKRDLLRAQMSSMLATNLPTGSSTDSVNQSLSLKRLRIELAKLQMKYSDKHPDVIKTKKQIDMLEKKLVEVENTDEVIFTLTGRTSCLCRQKIQLAAGGN
jgi:hypothetical protein